jgi:hypothetical protein
VSSSERFTILITGLSLLFTVLCVGIGLIVRITAKWTRVEDKLEHLVENVGDLVRDGREADDRLGKQIDRLDERLTRHESWHDDHPAYAR